MEKEERGALLILAKKSSEPLLLVIDVDLRSFVVDDDGGRARIYPFNPKELI